MTISIPRGPIVTVGIGAYALFSLAMPIGVILKPAVGEVADVIMMFGFVWPYSLFLSLQGLLPAQGTRAPLAFSAVILFGLAIVWLFTSYVQKRLGYDRWSSRRAYLWAPWVWYLPLLALQVSVYALAILFGLPVGE